MPAMRPSLSLAATSCLVLAAGCSLFEPDEPDPVAATLTMDNLPAPGPDHTYELWIADDEGQWTSVTRLREAAEETSREIELPGAEAEVATVFALSIENEGQPRDEPGPILVAGSMGPGAQNWAQIGHAAALGTDFSTASASFVLDTPTTPGTDDYFAGIWWYEPSDEYGGVKNLPPLAAGWIYEGWVTTADGRMSTGRFDGAGADRDGAGPNAGAAAAYDAPGQDFVEPPIDLRDSDIAITVEPDPDTDAEPFFLTPFELLGILDVAPPMASDMFKNDSLGYPIASLTYELPPPE
jgi:hypothetical protein